jgi:hypothetical protein
MYKCRWYGASDLTTRANVDIMAYSDNEAMTKAKKIARELSVTNCRLSIYQGNRKVM